MGKTPSREANSFSPSKEISCILLKTNAHYHTYRSSPLTSILSQMNPFYNRGSYRRKILFSMILSRIPRSFKTLFSFCSSHQNVSSPPYVSHAAHITFFLISSPKKDACRDVQIMNLPNKQFHPLSC
jgi:hypothetical protein